MESVFIAIWKGVKGVIVWVSKPLRSRTGILRWILYGFATIAFLVAAFVGTVWMGMFGRIPDRGDLRFINNQVATEVYSADSVLLGRYYLQERSPVLPRE